MNKPYFVISLDFELLWGVFDKVDYKEKENYFNNTRRVIPEILKLFKDYEIHCTWATVGMMFQTSWEEWAQNIPANLPEYRREELSAYNYGKQINNQSTKSYCFAKDLILQIQKTPHQEIGTHTYSHYYCLEEGQTPKAFRADLKKSIELAYKMGIILESLVFPRNQFNEEYLDICFDLGIKSVRSNPTDWYWKDTQQDSLKTKIFRTGDAYFGPKNKSYPLSNVVHTSSTNKPLAQKASRLLRPYSSNGFLNSLKLKRIKSEMSAAARNGEIYHLWWHPHNFGNNSQENLDDLKEILEHFKKCQDHYGMESRNMAEITRLVQDTI